MSQNTTTVNAYLDGFRKNDHEQILSCLTDDIKWTVFGFLKEGGRVYAETRRCGEVPGRLQFRGYTSWRSWLETRGMGNGS